MPSITYDAGSFGIQHRDVDYLSDTIEIILAKSTYAAGKADTNSVYAAAEISGVTGYVGGFGGAGRKVLTSKTMSNDTVNHRTVYDAADPSAWTLGTGDTVGSAIIGKKGAASDATATPNWNLDVTDTPTNGSTFAITFDANGVAFTQQ